MHIQSMKSCWLSFVGVICTVLSPIPSMHCFAQIPGSLSNVNVRTLSQSQTQSQASSQILPFPKDKTVIEMNLKELLRYYPSELRRLEFSPNQDDLKALMEKIGERVQAFFCDFSNTSSKESVFLQRAGITSGVGRDFNYLISYDPNGDKPLLQEYRTDKQNRPIDQDTIKGFFITSGYLGLIANFHPSYQEGSRFRHLGKQTSDPQAYIVAFAHKLDKGTVPIEYTDTITGISSRLPVQGIAWVHPDTYQILRLRINLLASGNQSFMTEQSTDIKLSEFRFADAHKRLWLPREVVVTTLISGITFRNQHRYADYRLFDVTSDFTINRPQPHK